MLNLPAIVLKRFATIREGSAMSLGRAFPKMIQLLATEVEALLRSSSTISRVQRRALWPVKPALSTATRQCRLPRDRLVAILRKGERASIRFREPLSPVK